MAQNKAQAELESLLNIQGHGQDAAANLAKLETDTQDVMPTGEEGEASFALPEALATGIGAAWLLGPAGLLIGVAQGLLVKKEEQRAIDAMAAETDVLNKTSDIFDSAIEEQMLLTDNPENLEQLNTYKAMLDAGTEMTASPYQATRDRGQELITQAGTGLNQYTIDNETQGIEFRQEEARIERELGQETYDRHQTLRGQFMQESGNFEAQQATANNIIEALGKGDGASVTAALATMPLLVNPDAGATTEAEVEIWQKIGGTIDSLVGRVQKELGSGGLTDDTRKEIMAVTQQYKRNSIAFQQAREAHYGQRAVDEGVPFKYAKQYNLSGNLPVVQQGGFIRGQEHRDKEGSAVNTAVNDAGNFITEFIDNTSMAIGDFIDDRSHSKAHRDEFFRIHGVEPTVENGGLSQ